MKVLQLGNINYKFHATEQMICNFFFRIDFVETYVESKNIIDIIFEKCDVQVLGNNPIWKKNEPVFVEHGFYREVEETGIFYFFYEYKRIIVRYLETYNEALLVDTVLQCVSLSSLYYNYTPIHAATIGSSDHGVIIMGNSGAGKTTIETSLLYNGFSYFSDDIVFIDSEMRMFRLNERIVGLRRNTIRILNACYNAQIEPGSDEEEKLLWDVADFRSEYEWLKPRTLLFPEMCGEHCKNSIVGVDNSEAFLRMIELTISKSFPPNLKVEYLCRLKKLAILCKGYKVLRKNIFNIEEYKSGIKKLSDLIRKGEL